MDLSCLPTWELLQKRLTWSQLPVLEGLQILDFGSGNGATAAHFAACSRVVAVEPDGAVLSERFTSPPYRQLQGSLDALEGLADESFDAVLCHNVLEYVERQEETLHALVRKLKPGGLLSLLKHNRAGRIMQMVVLLNNFDHAEELLQGGAGKAEAYGAIRYYEAEDVVRWAPCLQLRQKLGQRVFWDLQQEQDIQSDPGWQERMLRLEAQVSTRPEFQSVAFFHHLIFQKI